MHPFVVLVYKMRKDYEKLFTYLTPPEPPAGLFNKIMARVREEKLFLSIKKRLILFSGVVLSSVGILIPVVIAFQTEFAQSGFSQFLSFIFSDFGAVTVNWQDFGLALLESLPATSLIAFLATMLILLCSIKHLTQAIKVIFRSPQLINS